MRTLRGSLLAVAVAVVVATLYVFISFCSVLYVGANDTGEVADAIVVMGAAQYDGRPSPQLAARLDHALLLFNDGRARFTEAEASRRYLRARGVADSRIVAESQGGSTWESVRNLSPVLRSEGAGSVLIVTDRYHLQRSILSAREVGFRAMGSATRTSPVVGLRAIAHALEESVGVGVGRVLGFQRLWRITD